MEIARTALMITGFVLVMMLLIEYLNILSEGVWQTRLSQHVWGQHLLAAFLGAIPGCLGAFAAVAMYAHGILTIGALVTAMIATSGDEAFIMLAMVPRQGSCSFSALRSASWWTSPPEGAEHGSRLTVSKFMHKTAGSFCPERRSWSNGRNARR